MMETPISRLALTLGEPAGIGPDICIMLAQKALAAEVIVVGSPELLMQRAILLGLPLELYEFDPSKPPKMNGDGRLAICPIELIEPCIAGEPVVANSRYVLQTLNQGFLLCEEKTCAALVTGPVNKAIIAQGGTPFSGHTEYLAQLAQVEAVLMTFYTPTLLTGLVTTHCPLNAVSDSLTPKKIDQAIELMHQGLIQIFKKPKPRINVCGLNPHAGEMGLLGKEEQTIITPVIKKWQANGYDIQGPVPADTAFTQPQRQATDAILAMYHDQALAPLKALFFNEIVNITLGLPFLRTSVDHGTAFALAGTGKADPSSLLHAVNAAVHLS